MASPTTKPAPLSPRSLQRLNECDIRLRSIFLAIAERVPTTILCGHRDQNAQDLAYANGTSKLRWPYGKHNKMPSQATDAAPAPLTWGDKEGFVRFAAEVLAEAEAQGIGLRWGGNWDMDEKPGEPGEWDLVHFELVHTKGGVT